MKYLSQPFFLFLLILLPSGQFKVDDIILRVFFSYLLYFIKILFFKLLLLLQHIPLQYSTDVEHVYLKAFFDVENYIGFAVLTAANCQQILIHLFGLPVLQGSQELFLGHQEVMCIKVGVSHPHADLVSFAYSILKSLIELNYFLACDLFLRELDLKVQAQLIKSVLAGIPSCSQFYFCHQRSLLISPVPSTYASSFKLRFLTI